LKHKFFYPQIHQEPANKTLLSGRNENLIDDDYCFETGLEDEPEDEEEEKSGSECSDDDESRHGKLEEFQNENVDCASGDVTFINDMGKDICDDQSLATMCAADANEDTAEGDQNEIEVR
jgi:hypothetical protein